MTEAEIEFALRREWWLNHGHTGMYGDDGEMQCGMCRMDYKRAPITDLQKVVFEARMVRGAEAFARMEAEKERANPERQAKIAKCPTPIFHETHRYCPSCPWTEDDDVAPLSLQTHEQYKATIIGRIETAFMDRGGLEDDPAELRRRADWVLNGYPWPEQK